MLSEERTLKDTVIFLFSKHNEEKQNKTREGQKKQNKSPNNITINKEPKKFTVNAYTLP